MAVLYGRGFTLTQLVFCSTFCFKTSTIQYTNLDLLQKHCFFHLKVREIEHRNDLPLGHKSTSELKVDLKFQVFLAVC